ncbi:MAG TPA: hypothetical protein VGB55_03305 [Tepidisphaeraceae bacterium]|jgi:hypothetical protein
MKTIDLHSEVAAAVAMRWDDFAAQHPRLASVIDQHLLVESVQQSLKDDADYQRTLANAQACNASLETMAKLIDKYVVKWIAKLV